MNYLNAKYVPIPAEWRESVVAILRSGEKEKIQSTVQSDNDWASAFPDAWAYQRPDAMANALETDGISGRHITDMVPECDTYEFFFHFDGKEVLGKIGLLPNGIVIIIFSSHIPRQGR